jgi:RNA polymerase sigma-70 factor (ECF subfamily)
VGSPTDAEDITQEVFVKVWKNLKRFDPSKNFKTWIFTIAKNTALDYFKKKKTINFSVFENEAGENLLWETLVDPKPLSDEILMQANLTETMNMVIKHLTKKYQIVLFLYYYKNFTFKEISITLGESVNTVKSRHRRALLLLKKILPVKL